VAKQTLAAVQIETVIFTARLPRFTKEQGAVAGDEQFLLLLRNVVSAPILRWRFAVRQTAIFLLAKQYLRTSISHCLYRLHNRLGF